LVWTQNFWQDRGNGLDLLSRADWNFHNTVWDYTNRHASENQEHQETVKDPSTNVTITDDSENRSDYARDYSLYINETYTVSDKIRFLNHQSFEQQIKFTSDDGDLTWVTMSVAYDGTKWYQNFEWNGLNGYSASYDFDQSSNKNSGEVIATVENKVTLFDATNRFEIDSTFNQIYNIWFITVTDRDTDREFSQYVMLEHDYWLKQYYAQGVLIWEDSWNTEGTIFDWRASETHLLAATDASQTEEDSFSTGTIIGASILGFTILACAYVSKTKKAVSDDFQRA